MTYNKPKLSFLGDANAVIQGQKQPPEDVTDQPIRLTESGGIYDTEE